MAVCEAPDSQVGRDFKYLYELEGTSIEQKIEAIAKQIYRAGTVTFTPLAAEKITVYKQLCVSYADVTPP